MSHWRRIALEELPFCKRLIEEANDPSQMWIKLWDEFLSSYSTPSETEKMQKIYNFALWGSRGDKSKPLALGAWHFFHHIVGQFVIENSKVRNDLPKRMSPSDFGYWLSSVETEFPEEKFNNARKAFYAAKHKSECGTTMHQQRHNKVLQPTTYSFVPHFAFSC